jgi:hypothetical protein
MRVRSRHAAIALAACAALTLAACDEDSGEVAVKVASGFVLPTLAVSPDKFFGAEGQHFKAKDDGSPTVLREDVGPTLLQYERNGSLLTACSFNVRKNRVVTVTLRSIGREVKCDIVQ